MSLSHVRTGLIVMVATGLLQGATADAQEAKDRPADTAPAHVVVTPMEIEWTNGPASLPAGAQAAVIEGDPKQPSLFTMRLKLPANYKIPPHWHPADEHVTVMSGTFNMGMGDQFDQTKGKALPTGSFAVMPATVHHFAWTSEETILQLHGMGPWAINYLNPADDPRNAS